MSAINQDARLRVMLRPGVALAYSQQYFGQPWSTPETIVLVHGSGESSEAWQQWVGPLATRYRIIRPDLPGFGYSPTPDGDYSWAPQDLAADLAHLLSRIGVDRFHLVGAKYGGSIALQLAADQPGRVMTVSAFSAPIRGSMGGKSDLSAFTKVLDTKGVRGFAASTMKDRLGSDASQAQVQWWIDDLSSNVTADVLGKTITAAGVMDLEPRLPDIKAPTLIVTTTGNAMQTTDSISEYQKKIPHSRLVVMKNDSYHIAAVRPQECADLVLGFIAEQRAAAPA